VQVGDEIQVREVIEATQAGLKLCPDLDPGLGFARCRRLQRHSLQAPEGRAHDTDGAVGDRPERIVWLHTAEPTHVLAWARELRDAEGLVAADWSAAVHAVDGPTVRPHASAVVARDLALEHPTHRLPVVDESGALVGIIAVNEQRSRFCGT